MSEPARRHRDLHVLDELSIPDEFEERVGDAEKHEVLYGFSSETMINPKYLMFTEGTMQDRVQTLR